ncbi:MAG: hypothetical protein AB7G15_19635 [Alphaproteobacteria bacterium]
MIKSKLRYAGPIAALAVGLAAASAVFNPSGAEAPDPFNKAERNAALTTEPEKPSPPPTATPQTVTQQAPAGNTYAKPNKK